MPRRVFIWSVVICTVNSRLFGVKLSQLAGILKAHPTDGFFRERPARRLSMVVCRTLGFVPPRLTSI